MWVWGSTRPGITALPPRSISRSAAPRHSPRGPTQVIRPSSTAIAASAMTVISRIAAPRAGPSLGGVANWAMPVRRVDIGGNLARTDIGDRGPETGDQRISLLAGKPAARRVARWLAGKPAARHVARWLAGKPAARRVRPVNRTRTCVDPGGFTLRSAEPSL